MHDASPHHELLTVRFAQSALSNKMFVRQRCNLSAAAKAQDRTPKYIDYTDTCKRLFGDSVMCYIRADPHTSTGWPSNESHARSHTSKTHAGRTNPTRIRTIPSSHRSVHETNIPAQLSHTHPNTTPTQAHTHSNTHTTHGYTHTYIHTATRTPPVTLTNTHASTGVCPAFGTHPGRHRNGETRIGRSRCSSCGLKARTNWSSVPVRVRSLRQDVRKRQ
jgi:hypothetical protein